MQLKRIAWIVLSATWLVWATGCFTFKQHGELPTAGSVNLQSVLGTWYVQGAMTTMLDRNPTDAIFVFSQNLDGTLRAEYEFKPDRPDANTKIYTAKVLVGDTPADWKVQFLWPFRNDYRVLHMDGDTLMLGHPTRKYLYIMSRAKSLNYDKMEWLLDLAASRGFDTSYLKRIEHP